MFNVKLSSPLDGLKVSKCKTTCVISRCGFAWLWRLFLEWISVFSDCSKESSGCHSCFLAGVIVKAGKLQITAFQNSHTFSHPYNGCSAEATDTHYTESVSVSLFYRDWHFCPCSILLPVTFYCQLFKKSKNHSSKLSLFFQLWLCFTSIVQYFTVCPSTPHKNWAIFLWTLACHYIFFISSLWMYQDISLTIEVELL